MACFMICYRRLLLWTQHTRFAFKTSNHTLDGQFKVAFVDGRRLKSSSDECSLVANVGKVRTTEPRRQRTELLGQQVRVHI